MADIVSDLIDSVKCAEVQACTDLEITIKGGKLWVNVEGVICVLRVARFRRVVINEGSEVTFIHENRAHRK